MREKNTFRRINNRLFRYIQHFRSKPLRCVELYSIKLPLRTILDRKSTFAQHNRSHVFYISAVSRLV